MTMIDHYFKNQDQFTHATSKNIFASVRKLAYIFPSLPATVTSSTSLPTPVLSTRLNTASTLSSVTTVLCGHHLGSLPSADHLIFISVTFSFGPGFLNFAMNS